ncbi:MAG: tRNA pseudouridine(38-40) synthase TruA [Polyangiaceae bacterium]
MISASPPTHGVLLEVAYDGTNFSGWATQPGRRTVQDTLDGAIKTLDPNASTARGTSRTDAGVHAQGQRVAFDASLPLPPRGWVLALNSHLPADVAVRSARSIVAGYNPRFSSKKKRYCYRLLLDRVRDPLLHDRAWRIGWPLDLEKMSHEASCIMGTHDFSAFRSAHDERVETVRTIMRSEIVRENERIVSFVIEGNAFMYNMVRILVGTLVDVGRSKLPEGAIARALENPLRAEPSRESGDTSSRRSDRRKLAGMTAPAHGLTLEMIDLNLPEGAGESWPP